MSAVDEGRRLAWVVVGWVLIYWLVMGGVLGVLVLVGLCGRG